MNVLLKRYRQILICFLFVFENFLFCQIEKNKKRRGKSDIWNAIMGGCAAGAALSAKGGPQAMALGCAGFAAFSSICFRFLFCFSFLLTIFKVLTQYLFLLFFFKLKLAVIELVMIEH